MTENKTNKIVLSLDLESDSFKKDVLATADEIMKQYLRNGAYTAAMDQIAEKVFKKFETNKDFEEMYARILKLIIEKQLSNKLKDVDGLMATLVRDFKIRITNEETTMMEILRSAIKKCDTYVDQRINNHIFGSIGMSIEEYMDKKMESVAHSLLQSELYQAARKMNQVSESRIQKVIDEISNDCEEENRYYLDTVVIPVIKSMLL